MEDVNIVERVYLFLFLETGSISKLYDINFRTQILSTSSSAKSLRGRQMMRIAVCN